MSSVAELFQGMLGALGFWVRLVVFRRSLATEL